MVDHSLGHMTGSLVIELSHIQNYRQVNVTWLPVTCLQNLKILFICQHRKYSHIIHQNATTCLISGKVINTKSIRRVSGFSYFNLVFIMEYA